jgi:hypothetical protein
MRANETIMLISIAISGIFVFRAIRMHRSRKTIVHEMYAIFSIIELILLQRLD